MATGKLPVRVYYEDTDSGGIVYYANYLRFAERGRTELLRTLGVDHQQLLRDYNMLFAVKLFSIDYQVSAKLDDLLIVETTITNIGGASMDMSQVIRHEQGHVLISANTKLVAITPTGQVLRIPNPLRQVFETGHLSQVKE